MSSEPSIPVLNRVLAAHYRTLARYLSYASPTWHRGDENARAVLRNVADSQQETVDRLGALVVESGGAVDYGQFPIEYTGYHDLGFGFLLKKLVDNQQRLVRLVEEAVRQPGLNSLAKATLEEILGLAKGHLENFRELQQPIGAVSGSARH